MTDHRPHPFDLVFGGLITSRFEPIREVVGPERDVAKWLMAKPVVELLHDLRPEEGLGDSVDGFVLLVHAAYLWWATDGETISAEELELPLSRVVYIQVEPRKIWAQLGEDDVHEPLDGWFAIPESDEIKVVACFGVHRSRPGLSIMTAAGPRPTEWQRPDGSTNFSPVMCGGDTAELNSIAASEELLLLAWGHEVGEQTNNGEDGPKRSGLID